MQLINHGVNESLMESVKSGIQEFFSLPMEKKKQFWQQPEDVEGFGQAFVLSEEQKLDWGDMFYLITLPKHLRKPHLFPMLPQPFRYFFFLDVNILYYIVKTVNLDNIMIVCNLTR